MKKKVGKMFTFISEFSLSSHFLLFMILLLCKDTKINTYNADLSTSPFLFCLCSPNEMAKEYDIKKCGKILKKIQNVGLPVAVMAPRAYFVGLGLLHFPPTCGRSS